MSLIDFPTLTFIRRNGVTSASIRCDHCRAQLGSRVHRYWHMRFCSSACMSAYRERLSPDTQRKIVRLDIYRLREAS
jgi:hypothetical protein